MKTFFKLLFPFMVVSLAATTTPAQPFDDWSGNSKLTKQERKMKWEKRHKKMRAMRGKLLRNRLKLSEYKAQQVEAIFSESQEDRREARKTMRKTRKALRQLLKSDSNDQDAYSELLETLQETHTRLRELREEQASSLKNVLQPKEQAQLFMALKKMRRKMHGKHKQRRQNNLRNRQRGEFMGQEF